MKKKICFDLDNTICFTKNNDYKSSKPKKRIINLINKLDRNKLEVIIFTARFMGRFNDDIKKTKLKGYRLTQK